MALQDPDQQDEQPLDPVMENVRRKMIRLQLVSGGIMAVMFMAVLGAIVYKLTRPSASLPVSPASSSVPSEAPVVVTAALPAGFIISDISLSGPQMLVSGTLGGERKAIVIDIASGRIVADVTLETD